MWMSPSKLSWRARRSPFAAKKTQALQDLEEANYQVQIAQKRLWGSLETIKDGFNGYLAEAENTDSMAEQMIRFIDNPLPRENVAKAAANMSWENYCQAILAG